MNKKEQTLRKVIREEIKRLDEKPTKSTPQDRFARDISKSYLQFQRLSDGIFRINDGDSTVEVHHSNDPDSRADSGYLIIAKDEYEEGGAMNLARRIERKFLSNIMDKYTKIIDET